jgi:hypothetical protein
MAEGKLGGSSSPRDASRLLLDESSISLTISLESIKGLKIGERAYNSSQLGVLA